MKKAVLAVFSISLTAGTLYFGYTQLKDYLIKKLVGAWADEMKKQKAELLEDVIKKLKEELDKLYLWEVKQLADFSEKVFSKTSEKEVKPMLDKIKEKGIMERADLKAVYAILQIK